MGEEEPMTDLPETEPSQTDELMTDEEAVMTDELMTDDEDFMADERDLELEKLYEKIEQMEEESKSLRQELKKKENKIEWYHQELNDMNHIGFRGDLEVLAKEVFYDNQSLQFLKDNFYDFDRISEFLFGIRLSTRQVINRLDYYPEIYDHREMERLTMFLIKSNLFFSDKRWSPFDQGKRSDPGLDADRLGKDILY